MPHYRERVKDLKIDMLNEPREGKKLLVLDIDYTLFGKCPTIEKRVKDLKIDMLNEPREGKKLLVLDIDYTLFGK